MVNTWRIYLGESRHRMVTAATFISTAVVLSAFGFFLSWNESRRGYLFNDPVLRLFQSGDLSLLTFGCTYLLGFSGLIISLRHPTLFLRFLQAYILLTILRIFCLSILPLEPPAGIVPLRDILLRSTFYSGRDNLKDLFFSGHTATLFLFCFGFRNLWLKWLYGAGAAFVGILLMAQHVHYSIDVAAAPLFALLALYIQRKIMKDPDPSDLPLPQK